MNKLLNILGITCLILGTGASYVSIPLGVGYFLHGLAEQGMSFLTVLGYSFLVSVVTFTFSRACYYLGLTMVDEDYKNKVKFGDQSLNDIK